jgi:hypothetical protein
MSRSISPVVCASVLTSNGSTANITRSIRGVRIHFTSASAPIGHTLADGTLVPDYSGIRPKLTGPGQPAADFMIEGPASMAWRDSCICSDRIAGTDQRALDRARCRGAAENLSLS